MQIALDFFRALDGPRERTRPAPPKPGPVLLGDCATAANHSTLLLALWQKWERDTDPEA